MQSNLDPMGTPIKQLHTINVDLILYKDHLVIKHKGSISKMQQSNMSQMLAFKDIKRIQRFETRNLNNGLMQMIINPNESDAVFILYFSKQHRFVIEMVNYIQEYTNNVTTSVV